MAAFSWFLLAAWPPTRCFAGPALKILFRPEASRAAPSSPAGAAQIFGSGGVDSGATVLGSGLLVASGGITRGAKVLNGGIEFVSSGGVASAPFISNGGREYVYSGGVDRGLVISSGGLAFIYSGGTVSGGTVISGATLTVSSGGSVLGNLTLSGGKAVVSGTVAAGQQVKYLGSGGDLVIGNLGGFAAVLSGFSAGDAIDLRTFSYSSSNTRSFTEAGSLTSGTLKVTAGAQTANLTLLGNYATSNFALSNDGTGGTLVKYV